MLIFLLTVAGIVFVAFFFKEQLGIVLTININKA